MPEYEYISRELAREVHDNKAFLKEGEDSLGGSCWDDATWDMLSSVTRAATLRECDFVATRACWEVSLKREESRLLSCTARKHPERSMRNCAPNNNRFIFMSSSRNWNRFQYPSGLISPQNITFAYVAFTDKGHGEPKLEHVKMTLWFRGAILMRSFVTFKKNYGWHSQPETRKILYLTEIMRSQSSSRIIVFFILNCFGQACCSCHGIIRLLKRGGGSSFRTSSHCWLKCDTQRFLRFSTRLDHRHEVWKLFNVTTLRKLAEKKLIFDKELRSSICKPVPW